MEFLVSQSTSRHLQCLSITTLLVWIQEIVVERTGVSTDSGHQFKYPYSLIVTLNGPMTLTLTQPTYPNPKTIILNPDILISP
jgi:hypothetical protein